MKTILGILLFLASLPLWAADLETNWDPVTVDDAGEPLPDGQPGEYRIYPCGSDTPVATVPGTETSLTEPDVVTGTGTFCREVAAYLSPFEGARTQGTVIVVIPGATGTVNVQALQ